MKVYFSTAYGFEWLTGIHLLPKAFGTGLKSDENLSDVVSFIVYYVKSKNLAKRLGSISVLTRETFDTTAYFKKNGALTKVDGVFDISELLKPNRVISIPADIDYYKAIAYIFTENLARDYLRSVCDASYYNKQYRNFKKWPSFEKLLSRDNSSTKSILDKGYRIAYGCYEIDGALDIVMSELGDSFEQFTFKFSRVSEIKEDINLLIGKNGLGKTHIIKNICDIVTGLKEKEKRPLLNKLIVVAYSPFEEFLTKRELELTISELYGDKEEMESQSARLIVNDYAYIGFKNREGIFDRNWPKEHAARSIIESIRYDNEVAWWADKGDGKIKSIFSTLSLSMDFDTIKIKTVGNDVIEISVDNLNKINLEAEFDYSQGVSFYKGENEVKMSSGQLIYSYMIPSIISELQDETLVVIDEPELYLHPALEVGLINMLKKVLAQTQSFSIIATHSAVLAREVQGSCVKVLREATYGTQVDKPNIETYGESLDVIVGEIFGDYEIKKPFQHEIDEIINSSRDKNNLISKISSRLGDEGLIYMVSKINNESETTLERK